MTPSQIWAMSAIINHITAMNVTLGGYRLIFAVLAVFSLVMAFITRKEPVQ